MKYRRMGRTGLKVSELSLGTMTFGTHTDTEEADRMLNLSFDAGINFIDTADAYGGGQSEEMLGKLLGPRREDAILATKFFNPMGAGINDSGMSRVRILKAIDASLKRLKTDYIDLYYIHHVDTQTPLEEMLEALNDLVRSGKVRYIACSNYEAWRLMESLWISDSRRWARFECYQPQYNLLTRDIEEELVPLCQYKGLGVAVWSPLANGILTGKYRGQDGAIQGTRSADKWVFNPQFFAPNANEIVDVVLEIANELSCSPAQVATRWVLDQPIVTSVIVGARNIEQFRNNLGSCQIQLTPDQSERLESVSRLPMRYPKSMEFNMHERRDNAVEMPSLADET
ncbi:MAG: aldo/keto reductase [Opitutaceae bacterium]|nr:aldo/keto reductase [Opitutaceae bacterium]